MNRFLLAMACIVITAGCVTMTARSYDPAQRLAPTDPEEVIILDAAPLKEHLVIGEITLSSATYSERELKKKAAGIGGEAVIIAETGRHEPLVERGQPEVVAGPDGTIRTYDRPRIKAVRNLPIVAKVIRFPD
ncbi:hypothetical protein ACFL5X_02770 [Candidatus Omnitrophota bacterium]